MSDAVRNPFDAAGPPVAKFNNVGDAVEGTITRIEFQEDKDVDGNVRTFADGKPRPVVVVYLETADGEMRDFVKGRSVSQFRQEVHAVEGEGASPQVGAHYRREFTATAKPTGPGRNPEKLFQVDYGSAQNDEEDFV